MITLVSGSFPEFDGGIFTLRQKAYFNAYGADTPFYMLWVQKNSDGKVTAVISSLSGDVTLSLGENADFDEIKSFLYTVGFSSVFFDAGFEKELCFPNTERGVIMRLEKEAPADIPEMTEPDYKAVFDLIFEDGKASFGDWFTDLSHKIRRNSADIVTKVIDGRTVACAVCVAKTDEAALIGAVNTKEEYRKKGIGSELVSGLCALLSKDGRQIYICREDGKNEQFYSRLGFENCGEWMTAYNE